MRAIKHRSELHLLIDPPGAVAEIGVAEGRFSLEIAQWPNVETLYVVDRWRCCSEQRGDASMPQSWHDLNLKAMKERLKPFRQKVHILRGNSVDMAQYVEDESLALVYIDGDHSYEGVRGDIIAWAQKVRPGGYLAFHDFENETYGVKRAVEEYAKFRKSSIYLIPENNPEDAGAFLLC